MLFHQRQKTGASLHMLQKLSRKLFTVLVRQFQRVQKSVSGRIKAHLFTQGIKCSRTAYKFFRASGSNTRKTFNRFWLHRLTGVQRILARRIYTDDVICSACCSCSASLLIFSDDIKCSHSSFEVSYIEASEIAGDVWHLAKHNRDYH